MGGIAIITREVDEKIDLKLKKIKKSPKMIKEVFTSLEKSDNPIAHRVVDEHPIFSKLKGQKFNE